MILVIGGARSGKSTFAEEKAKEISSFKKSNVAYIATSIAFDDSMKDRIKKHRQQRDKNWITIERYKDFKEIIINENFKSCDIVLIDCLTLMISNLLLEYKGNFDNITPLEIDEIEKEIEDEIKSLINVCCDKEIIVVSNEVGLGIVPAYRLGAVFRDIAGRMNQFIARESKEVYLLTAGIPLKIK